MARRRQTLNAPRFVTPREFIEAWQTSKNVAEVAMRLGLKKGQCRVRACRYRKRGVPLKEFPWIPPTPPDWSALAEFAAELVPGKAGKDGPEGSQ